MKIYLTLQEKLRDLRDERKLKLQEVSDATSISLATLQRGDASSFTIGSDFIVNGAFTCV